MRVDLFDFDLPDDRIALRPASPRDSARLLRIGGEGLADHRVADLPDLLKTGDALVFNDTRVIPARLTGTRLREGNAARIEATLHMRAGLDRWRAFLRPAKRVKVGERIRFGHAGESCFQGVLEATVAQKGEAGEALLVFDLTGAFLEEAIAVCGQMPLPPYIAGKRALDDRDARDYQTVYARHDGAVAAPTAGLHFTPELLARLDARGITRHFVTLHVGAGTFLPVKVDETDEHKMHAEWGEVSADTAIALNDTRRRGGRIVAVGTTTLRLLESAAALDGTLNAWTGTTDIFITPGYRLRAADILMTNFHLPRSTLFMLVCAFGGMDRMKEAYRHAVDRGYRFYSYGDGSLVFRDDGS